MKPGDAIAVVGLLAFAIGWIVMATWGLDESSFDGRSTLEQLVAAAMIAAPAIWALRLVDKIVSRRG